MVQSAMENGPDSGRLSGATSDIEIGPLMGSWNILDVGCGSGLVGKVFRAFVDSDISSDTRSDTSASASAGAGAEEAIVSSLPSLSLSEGKDSIEAGDYSPLDFALQDMRDMRDMRDMKDMKWSTKGSSKGKGVKGTRGIKRGCMVGVDISSKMTEITARTGHYHYTACGDAVDSIRAFVPPKNLLKSEESGDSGVSGVSCPVLCLDMVVAADTFIYLGPLAPVFCAARAALKGGGLLVFSVEDLDSSPMRISSIKAASTVASTASMLGKGKAAAAGTGTGTFTSTSTDTLEDSSSKDKDKDKDIDKDKESFLVEAAEEVEVDEPLAEHCQLLSSSRYAHSEAYISLMCGKFGFRVEQQMKVVLRTESTATPPELYGLMYVVRKEGK